MNIKNKILNLTSNKKDLLKGTYQTVILKVFGMLLGYIFIGYISRNYGAESVGIYQISVQFLAFISTIALLGFNQSIVRYIADFLEKNNFYAIQDILRFFSSIALSSSLLLSAIIFLFAKDISLILLKSTDYYIIFYSFTIILPFLTLNSLLIEFIRGLNKIKISETLRLFSIRFIGLVSFFIIIFYKDFNNYLPIYSFEVGVIITFLITMYLSIRYVSQYCTDTKKIKVIDKKSIFKTSFIMYQSILFSLLSSQILVFLLAYLTNPREVGIYNISYQIASLTIFIFGAIITAVAPKYAKLYWNDKIEFEKIVKFSSKIVFWITGTISLLTMLFSKELLSLFGNEFIIGSNILIILSISNLFNAMTGPGGVLLDMVGKHNIRRNALMIATVIALIIAPSLIKQYAGIGLAIVLLVHNLIGNTITVIYLYKKMNINLIYIPYWTKS